MIDPTTEHPPLLRSVLAWSEGRDDIIAVVMTGSRARPESKVDQFSDFDIELFTTDPGRYADEGWVAEIGRVWVCLPLTSDDGHPIRLVFYEGGEKVDFQVRPAGELDTMADAGSLRNDNWRRGYLVLVDPTGVTTPLPTSPGCSPVKPRPSEAEYLATNTEFWFEAAHIPRYLVRDELWVVKFRDWTMKQMLLRMIEWHALATRGSGQDVWYIGTKMKDWAQPELWSRLHEVFGRFDGADSWRAMRETISLFRALSAEVASGFGYPYPQEQDEAVSAYIASFESQFASSL